MATTEDLSKLVGYAVLKETGPNASKINAYVVLNDNAQTASKVVAYAVLAQAETASKINAYAVLSAIATGGLTETTGASAVIDATAIAVGALPETTGASDSVDATATGAGDLAETTGASDAVDATSTGNTGDLAEGSAASDTQDATFVGGTSPDLVEQSAASDTVDAASTGNTRDIEEPLGARDSVNAIFFGKPGGGPGGGGSSGGSGSALGTLLLANTAICEYSYAQGLGTYALGGAWGGKLRLSSLYGTGDTVTYKASDASANSEWLIGAYDASANTLTRGPLLASTNNGQPINWSGRTRLFITPVCECNTVVPRPPPTPPPPPPPPPPTPPPPPPPGPPPPPPAPILDEPWVSIHTVVAPTIPTRSITLTTHFPNEVILLHVGMSSVSGPLPSVVSVSSTSGLDWHRRAAASGPTAKAIDTALGTILNGDAEVWWAISANVLTKEVISVTVSSPQGFLTLETGGVRNVNLVTPWDPDPSLPTYAINLLGDAPAATLVTMSTSNANSQAFLFYDDFFGAWIIRATGTPTPKFVIGDTSIQAFIPLGIDSYVFEATTSSPLSNATFEFFRLFATDPKTDVSPLIRGWFIIADALQAL